jgi:hypothetical protein
METKISNSDPPNLKIRFEKAIKIIDAIQYLFQLNKHIGNIIFDKKEELKEVKSFTLKEEMVYRSNKVFRINVQSVALPDNYVPKVKSESEIINWLRNKIQSQHSSSYVLSLKYAEKTKVKFEQK